MRTRYVIAGVGTLLVLVGVLVAIGIVVFASDEPADPGLRACSEMVHHQGVWSSGELKEYSSAFAQTEDAELGKAGSEWVTAELTSESELARTARLALLAQECERVGYPS